MGQNRKQTLKPCPSLCSLTTALGSLSSVALPSEPTWHIIAAFEKLLVTFAQGVGQGDTPADRSRLNLRLHWVCSEGSLRWGDLTIILRRTDFGSEDHHA